MKWTPEQQKVIDCRDRNILVSAAAGSGKTAVLVERIIQRITDEKHPVDIDRLLVVTFTKAAAAEMKERIGNAIEKCQEEKPDDENLRKQATLIHNAQITTIDSFCLFVVRNHFEEIDLDPSFRIADQGEIKLMEMDVLEEVFEQEYAQKRPEFLRLVDAYSDKRSDKAVREMVTKIVHQSASSPWPKEWILRLQGLYEVETVKELQESAMMKEIFQYAKNILLEIRDRLKNLKTLAAESLGLEKYAAMFEADLKGFEGLEEIGNYEDLAKLIQGITFGRAASLGKAEYDPMRKESMLGQRTQSKEEIKELKEQYFSLPLEKLKEQLVRMKPVVDELVHLSLEYLDAMAKQKTDRHVMDFSDVEHAALNILVDETTKQLRPTAYEFQKQFDEIMIDEYQDSNQVQEEILCAIAGEANGLHRLFMVGDVKQSIYRFRLARPELFMEKYATYDLKDSKKQRIDLAKNFRSRSEVLAFTNNIFYKIMSADLGKVSYNYEDALFCGADFPPNPAVAPEILLYCREDENHPEEKGQNLHELEARMIGEKIRQLKKELQVIDKKTNEPRPLKNRDIVILLRGLGAWGYDFASVLTDMDIPTHVATATGYFSATEVQTVLAFLKILDNPYQDIPMAAVSSSAIVGLSNEELAQISLKSDGKPFSEAVLEQMEAASNAGAEDTQTVAEVENKDLQKKLAKFSALYHRLRRRVADTPIHHLLNQILEESGFGDYVKALPGGNRRSANLKMLIEKAIAYEKTSYKGLFHFVRYIDQLQKYEVDFGEADVIGENEDVVRIMTIHKSKGLEFPVVFVSGMSRKFNEMDQREKLVIHPDLGLGLDEITLDPKTKIKCQVRTQIADRIRRDNLGEELRVLYVAMTRAKEKLILTGSVKNEEEVFKKHTGMTLDGRALPFRTRNQAKSYLDWVAPAVLSYPDDYHFTFVTPTQMVEELAKKYAFLDVDREIMMEMIKRADKEKVKKWREGFAYTYPYENEAGRKAKYSVSELKKVSMVGEYDHMEGAAADAEFLTQPREPYIPDFAKAWMPEVAKESEEGKDATGSQMTGSSRAALRGTATHRILSLLPLEELRRIDRKQNREVYGFLEKQITRMIEQGRLTREMADLVYRKTLVEFLQSPIAGRMAEAAAEGDLFTEKPFVMDYQGVLVQGIIDVFWLEKGQLVLMDYKTDRVEDPQELIDRYGTQLKLYGEALCRVFQKEELKAYIYSLSANCLIDVKVQ